MDRRPDTVTTHATIPPDLLLAHSGALRALALSLLGDEHAAEDVLQETFVRALRSPPSSHERIGGWLRRVAEGFADKRRRAEKSRATREALYARERPEAVTDARMVVDSRGETLRAVVEAVLALEEPYRETVLLRWFEGLQPRAIAERCRVPVATVNSRLQRAHALLREKLERRLGDRDGGFMGALGALVGTRDGARAPWSSTTSISSKGLLLTTTAKLIACAAVAALIVGSALLLRSSQREPLAPPEVLSNAETPLAVPLETPPAASSPAASSTRASVSPAIAAERVEPPPVPGPFVFDVTFQPVDALGLPVPEVGIDLGPEHHPLNRLGKSAWNGELHVTWRGTEHMFDGRMRAMAHGAWITPLMRLQLVAGSPRTLRFLVDRGCKRELRGLGYTDGERLDLQRAESSAPPAFTLDTAGNGVFLDQFLAVRIRTPDGGMADLGNQPRPFTSRRLGGRDAGSSSKRSPRANIQGSFRDEHGASLANVPVCALVKSDGRRRDTRADELGRFAIDDLPPGAVELWSGGPEYTYQHGSIELVDGQGLTWDTQLGPMPMAGGRLVDASGTALAGYCVEARANMKQFEFIGCARTDDSGRFRLSFPMAGKARLCAWPGRDLRCALVASDSFMASVEDRDIVVRDVAERASLSFEIDLAPDLDESHVEPRLFRVDSGEVFFVSAIDDTHAASDAHHAQRRFRADSLFPGEYALEVLAPGGVRQHAKAITLLAGAKVNLGSLVSEPGGRLDARAAVDLQSGERKLSVVRHEGGVIVVSEELALPGSFLVPSGDVQLRITSAPEGSPALLRDLHIGSNAKVEVVVPERPR